MVATNGDRKRGSGDCGRVAIAESGASKSSRHKSVIVTV